MTAAVKTGMALIRRRTEQLFDDIKNQYPDWRDKSPDEVQAHYFAQRRTRSGEVIYEDSKTGEAQRDQEAYDLIKKSRQ